MPFASPGGLTEAGQPLGRAKGIGAMQQQNGVTSFQVGGGALMVRAKGDSIGQSSPLTAMARDESYEVQVGGGAARRWRRRIGIVLRPQQTAVHRTQRRPIARLERQRNLGDARVEGRADAAQNHQPR